jgi:hypothetical protein
LLRLPAPNAPNECQRFLDVDPQSLVSLLMRFPDNNSTNANNPHD